MSRSAGATTAKDFLPERRSLAALRRALQGCRGCELHRDATQAYVEEFARIASFL